MKHEPENLTLAHEETPASRTDKGVGSTGGSATDLLRRLEIYTLCPKCSQESRVPGSIKGTGFISNMHYCPHCGTQIDTWLRIPSLNAHG